MSSSRISVEWGIGRVKEQWKLLASRVTNYFTDYMTWSCSPQANMRALAQPVSILILNAVLFSNVLNIMNGSQVQDYFGVQPPTLSEYLWEDNNQENVQQGKDALSINKPPIPEQKLTYKIKWISCSICPVCIKYQFVYIFKIVILWPICILLTDLNPNMQLTIHCWN